MQFIYNVVLVSGVQQSASFLHILIFTLFKILFPYRSLQSIEQSSLCYIVDPYQLPILYLVVCIRQFMGDHLFWGAVLGCQCCWAFSSYSQWGLLKLWCRELQGVWASVVVADGFSCPARCEIFPDQGSDPCLLHWQADSQLLGHQGSPYRKSFLMNL